VAATARSDCSARCSDPGVGAERLCAALTDWLIDMELVSAGAMALLDRYIGYYEPYATSRDAFDKDEPSSKKLETPLGRSWQR
jgi:hypothetical protein